MDDGWIDPVCRSPGMARALRSLNRVRRRAPSGPERRGVDAAADALFDGPSRRLAVYGSLAPGEVNEHVLAPLDGRWEEGFVFGTLHDEGWGTRGGFPGLVWDPAGQRIPVRVFLSEDLPERWGRIDAFEGDDYRRALVPVEGLPGGARICNVYLVAGSGDADR